MANQFPRNDRDIRNWRKGYQEALDDIEAKLNESGAEGVAQWIADNRRAS